MSISDTYFGLLKFGQLIFRLLDLSINQNLPTFNDQIKECTHYFQAFNIDFKKKYFRNESEGAQRSIFSNA